MTSNTKQNNLQMSNQKSNRHEAAIKAAKTRKERDPQAFSKMGSKGGAARRKV